jgi:hypothetical protein
MKDAFYVCR